MKPFGRRLTGFFLTALLLVTTLPGLLSQEDNQVKLLSGVEILLPEDSQVRINWILPPVDQTLLENYGYQRCFSVDAEGFPWVGLGGRLIMNPLKSYCGLLTDYYRSFTHLDNGALFVAGEEDFGFIVAQDEVEYDEETGYPLLVYQPLALMPGVENSGEEIISRSMSRGENCLYFVVRKKLENEEQPERYEVYCLKPESFSANSLNFSVTSSSEESQVQVVTIGPDGISISDDSEDEGINTSRVEKEEGYRAAIPEFIPVYASSESITAVSGNGEITFIAHGQLVIQVNEGSSSPLVYYEHPTDIIMGLGYSKEAGLFYATNYSAGLMSEGKALEFLRLPSPRIFLKENSLFVMLSEQGAVIQMETSPSSTDTIQFRERWWRLTMLRFRAGSLRSLSSIASGFCCWPWSCCSSF